MLNHRLATFADLYAHLANLPPSDNFFAHATILVHRFVAFIAVDPIFAAANASLAAIPHAPMVTTDNAIVCPASTA